MVALSYPQSHADPGAYCAVPCTMAVHHLAPQCMAWEPAITPWYDGGPVLVACGVAPRSLMGPYQNHYCGGLA